MPNDNRLLDDLTRIASGAFSALAGVRDEVEARLRDQFSMALARFDMVTRDEFEAVREMAARARVEQEALASRLAAIESRLGIVAPATDPSAATPIPTPEAGTGVAD